MPHTLARAGEIPAPTRIPRCYCRHVKYFRGNSRYLRNCSSASRRGEGATTSGLTFGYFQCRAETPSESATATREGVALSLFPSYVSSGGVRIFGGRREQCGPFCAGVLGGEKKKFSVLTPEVLTCGPNGYFVQSSFSSVVVSKRTTAIRRKT